MFISFFLFYFSNLISNHNLFILSGIFNRSSIHREYVAPLPKTHEKCRDGQYPRSSNIQRFDVPEHLISWTTNYPEYEPPEFTSGKVLEGPEWADPDISQVHANAKPAYTQRLKFNAIDGNINRKSHMGKYRINEKRIPQYYFNACNIV